MRVIQQMAPGTDEGWEARTGFSPGGVATTTRRLIRELFFSHFPQSAPPALARRLDRQSRPVRLPGPLRRSSASLACLPRPGDRRGGVFLAPLARPSGTANRSSVNFSDV